MPKYGKKSQANLDTAEIDLITLFEEVVKTFDNTILYGYRSPTEQFELFKQGRIQDMNGAWHVLDKLKVVTYKDGTTEKSNHNFLPSRAVDATPYPINWKDTKRMYYFAGWVMATAIRLKAEGKMTHDIRFGGDWNRNTEVMDETFMDLCHFEILI